MGAIKIAPDSVAPGNGPKYNVITIGASNGVPAPRRPLKNRQSIILWGSGAIADSSGILSHYLFFSMSKYVG
ncbi:hypothetical protein [Serratia sp. FDAARGOS_506]|uniref:hypothetical protein n=1 Tax=Serratia sp. FDAARGOS_506 TaxID=2420306 RepID=UPI000F4FC4BB|nr:hypothetical protein [Serratia sp. FDAARGOS_506]